MPRTSLAIVLALALVLLAPAVAALAPGAGTNVGLDAGVGPKGPVFDQAEPYYLFLHAREPEAPREAAREDDCSYEPGTPSRPPTLEAALRELAGEVASWDPASEPRVSGWYPRCFSGTFGQSGLPVSGFVAYDVPTGRYYVTLWAIGAPVLPVAMTTSAAQLALTGTTGIGTEADCETCPPPP